MAGPLILQTAVDEGLGGFYFGIVPEQVQPFRDAFGVPDDHEPIGAIAIGYSAETSVRSLSSRRRLLADLVHYGSWWGCAQKDEGSLRQSEKKVFFRPLFLPGTINLPSGLGPAGGRWSRR